MASAQEVTIVYRRDIDPTGREVSSMEAWVGVSEAERAIVELAEKHKSERWPEKLMDRFAAIRAERYDPDANLRGAHIKSVHHVVIHFDNDDLLEEETDEEEESEEEEEEESEDFN